MPHADSQSLLNPMNVGGKLDGCRWLLPLISRVRTTKTLRVPFFSPSMEGWLLSATHLEKPAPLAGETPTRSHGWKLTGNWSSITSSSCHSLPRGRDFLQAFNYRLVKRFLKDHL